MTLWINTTNKYADAYYTNWHYLYDLTDLQMELLEEINWSQKYKEIDTSLWYIPVAFHNDTKLKDSVKDFINDLNNEIMEL
jgi:hypothetical protein